MESLNVHIPPRLFLHGKIDGNLVQQLARPGVTQFGQVTPYKKARTEGNIVRFEDGEEILVVCRNTLSKSVNNILFVQGTIPTTREHLVGSRWIRPKPSVPSSFSPEDLTNRCKEVRTSWERQFFFVEEIDMGEIKNPGLRSPQLGALYAALAHWTVTDEIGTVVMPTGTGKTETMLALLVKQRPERLLVVVPTSALRDQIGDKFLSLGILKEFGIIGEDAKYPIVGRLQHRLGTPQKVQEFFGCCNVVVSTMDAIGACSDEVQSEIARQCSHLFIDEAHHVPARTWNTFRQYFLAFDKPVLQFTATPFRRDGKHIGGKIIYNYPLRRAQEERYFKEITFLSIWEYNPIKADEAIASAAIKQLEDDLEAGYDHLIMARADSIERAIDIHKVYQELCPHFAPLLIHSKQRVVEKQSALTKLREHRSRIIVCINMLGEGFDLPQLKIAALHDMHKSLAVTLQFTGRFTRTSSNIGDATIIANSADAKVEEAIDELYARDSDWNILLRRLSEGATGRQERRSEFLDGFSEHLGEIYLHNIHPKMSAVVYRTKCTDWHPERLKEFIGEETLLAGPTINSEHKVALFITQERSGVRWGNAKDIQDIVHDLYLIHWSEEQNLLYINSTNNNTLHTDLAEAVVGENIELIRGESIYRSLHGINRPILMNLGLLHVLSRAAQFTMHVGSDIKSGLSHASLQNRRKSNLFGRGYEDGNRVSLGGSHKGRIWSHKIAEDISEWVEWCHKIGAKLDDDSISAEDILQQVIVPEVVKQRPSFVPITIEWSEYFYMRSEDAVHVEIDGERVEFYEAGFEISRFTETGPLCFSLFTENKRVEYEIVFKNGQVEYRPKGGKFAYIHSSGKRESLSDCFQREPPIVRFENNAFLQYNEWFEPKPKDREPFPIDRIEVWDWEGVDLKKESQMKAQKSPKSLIKREDSIQYFVIGRLIRGDIVDYDVVFDDDDTNEIADIVALKVAGEKLLVHLFHCKYSKKSKPGARVGDLYEVCGQAQKSVYWKSVIPRLFEHLKLREAKRQQNYNHSRFESGDLQKLDELARRSRFLEADFKVFIVQPGLGKSEVEDGQLDLLSATELYLAETYAVDFQVIGSK